MASGGPRGQECEDEACESVEIGALVLIFVVGFSDIFV